MTDETFRQLNGENLRRLERIETAAAEQKDELNTVVAGQARIEGAIETVKAIVEAQTERARDEITVLFGRTRDHGGKIEAIRVDYVPKNEFKAHEERNREEHKGFAEQIGSLTIKVASASAVGSFVGFLLGLAVQWFRK